MSGSGISWAICMSAPRFRQITMPVPHHSVFYRPDALPAAQPTASKHWRHSRGPSYGKFGEDWICRLPSFHDRRQTHTLVTIFPTAEQSDRIKRKLSIVATSTACSTTISAHNRRSTHISSRCIAPLWNSLPYDIRSSPSLPVFPQRLKTFIFRQSFPIVSEQFLNGTSAQNRPFLWFYCAVMDFAIVLLF